MNDTYYIKRGVSLFMSAEIEKILNVICPIFYSVKLPVVITSGLDGPHRENSLHYRFRAIDLRKNFKNRIDSESWTIHRQYLLERIWDKSKFLGYPIEVVEEEDHIHVEWNDRT